jgi:hypothetical protein
MRRLLLITASIVFVSAVVTAQHLNTTEVPVKGNLTVVSDVMVGTSVLKAGDYRYACDREHITFSSQTTGKPVLKVPCKGRELDSPSDQTTMLTTTDAAGKKVVTKLLLKGSSIEHVF